MGDNWEHILTVEAVEDGDTSTQYPQYIDGARRAPPEDCGGTPGFDDFLEAIGSPKHPEYDDAINWHQGCYGKAFDPAQIDELDVKQAINAIAKRRATGKA